MIELKKTCVGVRCPACNKNIIEYINRFQFSSGMDLFCPYCNTPILSIKKRSSDNFHLNCFGCGEAHTYSILAKSFFSEKTASFGCKVNKVDVLFTGSHEDVDLALCQLSEEIKILTDKYYNNLEQFYGRLSTAALRILEEKSCERRIVCLCGNYKLNLKISDGGIYLICPKCGGSEFIPISIESDIQALKARRCILIK